MPQAEPVFHIDFQMKYPGKEAYNMEGVTRIKHESPCMSSFWRSQEIRQGNVREETDRDEKPEEEE
jgi:hypothetical protein